MTKNSNDLFKEVKIKFHSNTLPILSYIYLRCRKDYLIEDIYMYIDVICYCSSTHFLKYSIGDSEVISEHVYECDDAKVLSTYYDFLDELKCDASYLHYWNDILKRLFADKEFNDKLNLKDKNLNSYLINAKINNVVKEKANSDKSTLFLYDGEDVLMPDNIQIVNITLKTEVYKGLNSISVLCHNKEVEKFVKGYLSQLCIFSCVEKLEYKLDDSDEYLKFSIKEIDINEKHNNYNLMTSLILQCTEFRKYWNNILVLLSSNNLIPYTFTPNGYVIFSTTSMQDNIGNIIDCPTEFKFINTSASDAGFVNINLKLSNKLKGSIQNLHILCRQYQIEKDVHLYIKYLQVIAKKDNITFSTNMPNQVVISSVDIEQSKGWFEEFKYLLEAVSSFSEYKQYLNSIYLTLYKAYKRSYVLIDSGYLIYDNFEKAEKHEKLKIDEDKKSDALVHSKVELLDKAIEMFKLRNSICGFVDIKSNFSDDIYALNDLTNINIGTLLLCADPKSALSNVCYNSNLIIVAIQGSAILKVYKDYNYNEYIINCYSGISVPNNVWIREIEEISPLKLILLLEDDKDDKIVDFENYCKIYG